ncbi:acyltransferase family protein [Limosilactobacillus walteri]|nr:acyltransferase family protein [Limosilactobacillus walteri]
MEASKRQSNIEMLRIVLILMVIILHYLNGEMGGALSHSKMTELYVSHFMESLCIVAVNTFILITGYFSYKKNSVNVNKTVKLFLIMFFYGLVLTMPILFYKGTLMSLNGIWMIITLSFSQWFVVIYSILYLLIPYINKLLGTISKRQLQILLMINFIFFYCWPTFFTNVTLADSGYGIINFINLYLVGAYIRLYNVNISKWFYLLIYFITTVLTFGFSIVADRAYSYSSIFNLISSIALFEFFIHINIGHHNWINQLATYTFAVYIIDVNVPFNKLLYRQVFHSNLYWNSNLLIVNLIITTIGVYLICIAIEFLRRILLDRLFNMGISKIKWEISV